MTFNPEHISVEKWRIVDDEEEVEEEEENPSIHCSSLRLFISTNAMRIE